MIQTFRVEYSQEAVDDLREIYAYIAFELMVPDTARNQVKRIREKIRSLDFMPEKYVTVDWEPWKSRNVHKVPVDNFVIFYEIENSKSVVTVLRIFYGGQDIENIVKSDQQD